MELMIRVHAHDRRHDLVVETDQDHTVGDLRAALVEWLDLGTMSGDLVSLRTGRVLPADALVADADLLSGDEVQLASRVDPSVPVRPHRAIAADVLAGPDSGRSELLLPGSYRIGRHDDCDIELTDPSVSRAGQAIVEIHPDWSVVITPLDSTNGVTVNDDDVLEPQAIQPDDVVGLGGTRIGFRPFVRAENERVDRLGQIHFHRTPYRPPVITERGKQEYGPVPARPEPRRFQVLSAIAPLAAGLTMFAFTRQVHFLALTLVTPVIAIANTVEERRSGRRRFRDELATYRTELGEWRTELEGIRHDERVERLRAAPDLAELVRRAELRAVDLWARGRTAPDFLTMRLGLGSDDVRFEVVVENGGDRDLRKEADGTFDGVDEVHNVPITVDLEADRIIGIHGERPLVDGVIASLLVQAACMHSPEDLTIVAATGADRPLGWLKWLPHTRSVTSPLPGSHVVDSTGEGDTLVRALVEVVEFRRGQNRSDDDRRWPRILAVIDERLWLDAAEVARLLDGAADAGVSVLWLAETVAGVPRQALHVLDVRSGAGAAMVGRLWSVDPTRPDRELEIEHLQHDLADRVARSLAPIRDASTASLATSIPRVSPLLEVLEVANPTSQWVAERWLGRQGYQLRFPIGVGADGVVWLDLVENGPHTLIGGTSGAGKSELLQSMVVALAATHPPERLNFLFVDYKGGASTQVFGRLPHCVGYVTNLEADLAMRALTSLRAELNRRMAIMEGRAKDLAEMLQEFPAGAPPSLVIVVDEFATLVKEVPDFIAGIVDIAQRGRSLGIHLVLATQRPSGSVNENILANTNLRISLRMLDRTESSSIIDSPEAADIPVPLRGRGFIRLGPRELVAFQSAFGGAPFVTSGTRQPVLIAPFDRPNDTPRPVATPQGDDESTRAATQISAVLDAIEQAALDLSVPEQRRPWRDVLPPVVTLQSVMPAEPVEHPGRFVTFGLLDAPERQEQRPAVIDLEQGAGWLIFGAGGSGKTTLLRTLAASISATSDPDDVAMLVLDFGSRSLGPLHELPGVIDVATGDDLEAVTRHLLLLDDELRRRRRILGTDAETLSAYDGRHGPLPRIVVMIDNFGGLSQAFGGSSGSLDTFTAEAWSERVVRVVTEGRQVGIHAVITADRRNSVPAPIQSAMLNRLILRQNDENGYVDHGVPNDRARQLDLTPGRGLLQGATTVQVASVTADATARGQADFMARFSAQLESPSTPVLPSSPFPARVCLSDLPPVDRPRRAVIGIADVSLEPVEFEFDHSDIVVTGPPRSGRSTALRTIATQLLDDHDVYVIGPPSCPLAELPAIEVSIGRPATHIDLIERLVTLDSLGEPSRPIVVVIDGFDVLDHHSVPWADLETTDHLHLIASCDSRAMISGFHTLAGRLKQSRRQLVLQPENAGDFQSLTGLRMPVRPGLKMTVGRGVLLTDHDPVVVQVATTDPS